MEFDIQPVLSEWNVLIGLVTPFVTAVIVKAKETDWVKGAVSIVVAALAGWLLAAQETAGVSAGEIVDQASGVLAVHLAAWLALTSDATKWLNQMTAAFGIGRENPPSNVAPKHCCESAS